MKNRINLLPTLVFGLLLVVFTYPLIWHLTDAIPGKFNYTDGPFFLWNLWWIKKALLTGHNPFYTNYIFYPQTVNLGFHTLTVGLGLALLPLTLILKNLILVANLMILVSIGLTGFFSYKFIWTLTKSAWASFIIACYLAFHPYVISRLYAGHYNLIQIWTIPAILWLIVSPVKVWWKKALGLGLLLAFQSYIDFHYTLFILLAGLIILACSWLLKQKYWDNLKIIGLALGIWLTLLAPILLAIKNSPTDPENAASRTLQTHLWLPLTQKNPFNPWWGKESWDFLNQLPGQIRENTLTISWSILGLALLSLLLVKKIKPVSLFGLIALAFLLITPGEKLLLWGREWTMPYTYLQNLPGFNQGLALPRFGLMVIISLAGLAGITLGQLDKKVKSKLKYLMFPAIFILIILEIFSYPLILDPIVRHPQQLKQNLDLTGDWAFQVIPHTPRSSYFIALLDKPMVGGYLGRRVNNLYQPYYNNLAGVRFSNQPWSNAYEGEMNQDQVKKNLAELKIRYIILDKEIISDQEKQNILPYLEFLNFPLVYADEQLTVYEIK